ncbi:MAG: T9SS type A sorting domain-containing protein [Pseudarcicella sp.]|nr:T9SS type A sorting domain-containing protein [Pseudarcicella sp.]
MNTNFTFLPKFHPFFKTQTYRSFFCVSFLFFCISNNTFAALPVAVNDFGGNIIKNTGIGSINITANDTDADGNPTAPFNTAGRFTIDLDTATAGIQTTFSNATGNWSLNTANGIITFKPAANYTGTAMINYLLCEPNNVAECDVATITFLVLEDTDFDGTGDFVDNDDDNDGTPDNAELNCSVKTLNASGSSLSTNLLTGTPIRKGKATINGITGGDINFEASLFNPGTASWNAFVAAVPATNTLSEGGVQFINSTTADPSTGGQVIYTQVSSTSNPNAPVLANVARLLLDFVKPYANFSAQFNGFNYQDALKVKAWYKGTPISASKFIWTNIADSIYVDPSNDFIYSNSTSGAFSVEGNSFVLNITTAVDSVAFYLGKSNNSNLKVTSSISNIKGCLMKGIPAVEDDFNSTFVNTVIQENISTNDLNVPTPVAGTTYGTPTPSAGNTNPAGAIVQLQINSNGTYSFTSNIAGFYTFDVPVNLPDGSSLVSKLTIIVASPLAIDLVKFEAKLNNNLVKINWSVANPKAFSHFVLQRGSDGRNFESIKNIPFANLSNYEVIDGFELKENNYYQLKMVNNDGTESYSKVIYVSKKTKNQTNIFPNPAKNTITIEQSGDKKIKTVRFYNTNGMLILEATPTANQCDISGLAQGIYLVETIDFNNIKSAQRFMKL